MNFLGHSLIDVSGVTVVCSPFFFRNNGSRRRRRNGAARHGASVNSRRTADLQRDLDRSLFVAISREGKRRSIEILAVPKINYGMSARRWRRRWRWRRRRRRRRRRRWLGGYFPGNSSRGRLEGFEAWSTRVGLLQLPANSVDVIRQQFQQHSRHIVGSRVPRNVPTRRHISGDASSSAATSLFIVQSICTRVRSLSFTLLPRFPRSDWPPLVTSKYNRILLVQFTFDCIHVRTRKRKRRKTKVST